MYACFYYSCTVVFDSPTKEVFRPCTNVYVSIAGDFSAVSHRGARSPCGFVADVPLPGDCHATAVPSLAMTMRYGFSLGLIMFNLIKRRVRPYNNVIPRERSDRGNRAARRGGTKCRKNSPQVTVFSQSGPTCCERGGKTYLRTRIKHFFRGGFLHCVRTSSSLRSK